MSVSKGQRAAIAVSTALLVVAAGVVSAPQPGVAVAAGVCDDTTAPTLEGFTISERNVDVRKRSATIYVTAALSDDSGVSRAFFYARTPLKNARSHRLSLTKGTARDGVWTGRVRIPRYTSDGTWGLEVSAVDKVGNELYAGRPDLRAAGYGSRFDVKSKPDVEEPRVRDFSFTPRSVDTRDGPERIEVTVRATDGGGSGVESVEVFFDRGPIDEDAVRLGSSLRAVPGSNKFVGQIRVSRRADRVVEATWNLELMVRDGSDNSKFLDASDLRQHGWNNRLRVVNKSDAHLPKLRDFSFTPTSALNSDLTGVAAKAKISDRGSGIRQAVVYMESQTTSSTVGFLDLSSGTLRDGTFQGSVEIRACAQPGDYSVEKVELLDRTGNARVYNTAELQSLGFPVILTVTS